MNESTGGADLHTHTTASDGTVSVSERIDLAEASGLDAVAITDHDTIADELDDRSRVVGSVEVVTGVEVRADVHGTKVELLGYFVDPTDSRLRQTLETVQEYRRSRNRSMVRRVNEKTGLDLDYAVLSAQADGNLGRPHLANRLVDAGVVDSVQAAFDEYLADDAPCFAPMERLPASEVIHVLSGAGGVTSLAHPGRIRAGRDAVESFVRTLSDEGLDALEVHYPYGSVRSDAYAEIGVADAESMAAENDLLVTGGSDCHGPGSGKHRIGDVRVSMDYLTAVRELAESRQ